MSPEYKLGKYWLERRRGIYYVYWYDAERKRTRRRSCGTKDFQAAQQQLAEFAVLHEHLRDQKPDDVPLATVLVRYYDQHAQYLRSEETSRNALRKWADFFAGYSVADITPDRQRQFTGSLKRKGYKNEYINRILTTGRAALNYAYHNQEIRSVPFIKLLPAGRPRTRILSMSEAAAIFNHSDGHLLTYCMIAFNTLSRPEAILELTPFQVDFQHRLIDLNQPGREQTKKHRPTIPISNTLMPWLRNREASHYVNYRGKPVKSIKTTWRKMRTKAGLGADVVPYTIRHTMATELRKRDVPPWEVSGFLGHSTAQTTERYAKFAPDYLSKGVTAIDDYFENLQRIVAKELVRRIRAVK